MVSFYTIPRYHFTQFHRNPLTIPWIPFDESVDILDNAVEKLWITHVVNPWIS